MTNVLELTAFVTGLPEHQEEKSPVLLRNLDDNNCFFKPSQTFRAFNFSEIALNAADMSFSIWINGEIFARDTS